MYGDKETRKMVIKAVADETFEGWHQYALDRMDTSKGVRFEFIKPAYYSDNVTKIRMSCPEVMTRARTFKGLTRFIMLDRNIHGEYDLTVARQKYQEVLDLEAGVYMVMLI